MELNEIFPNLSDMIYKMNLKLYIEIQEETTNQRDLIRISESQINTIYSLLEWNAIKIIAL
eukprot:GAHX01005401.1.p1 GENE.GAHX01005401.1~~GAHX01005401.1.p1  ORF type:complete len:61 (-),score=10.74 GAHX01005401.1:236-418(-)